MKLFEEFKSVSAAEWEEKILKDLKLSSIQELIWHTAEGIDIRAFYNHEHLSHSSPQHLFTHSEWEIVQYVPTSHHHENEINEYIIQSLNGGASGIAIDVYQPKNLSAIFNNVSLPHIYSSINISFDNIHTIEQFKDIYQSINAYTKQKNCFINIDPIFLYEKFGEWHHQKESDFEAILQLQHIPVNATLYKESGANLIQELAYTLAHLNEYLYYLEQKQQLSSYTHIHIYTSIGHSFFSEIARLRALRHLIQHLLHEYSHQADIYIHAQTTLINKSYIDIHSNIIRTTTEAMSAIFGGANAISILPFNYPFEKVNPFSLRIARNQLIIMKEESYLSKTAEVSAGNYFIENYTQQLIDAAYEKFLQIEQQNGLIHLLEQGIIQQDIEASFQSQLQKFIEQKSILVGINKYPPADKDKIKPFQFYYPSTNYPNALCPKRWAEYFELQTFAV